MFSSSFRDLLQLATPDFVSKKLHLRNEKVLCESKKQLTIFDEEKITGKTPK